MLSHPQHRLFFALRPPRRIAHQIAAATPHHAAGARFTPVLADRLHVTLDILEDFDGDPEPTIQRMIAAGGAVMLAPFTLTLDQAVTSSRSVALRSRRAVRGLADLARTIGDARSKAGLAGRARYRFSPHLTLCYRDGRPSTQAIEPIAWLVDEFFLIHSLLRQTRHRIVGHWPLRAAVDKQYRLGW